MPDLNKMCLPNFALGLWDVQFKFRRRAELMGDLGVEGSIAPPSPLLCTRASLRVPCPQRDLNATFYLAPWIDRCDAASQSGNNVNHDDTQPRWHERMTTATPLSQNPRKIGQEILGLRVPFSEPPSAELLRTRSTRQEVGISVSSSALASRRTPPVSKTIPPPRTRSHIDKMRRATLNSGALDDSSDGGHRGL